MTKIELIEILAKAAPILFLLSFIFLIFRRFISVSICASLSALIFTFSVSELSRLEGLLDNEKFSSRDELIESLGMPQMIKEVSTDGIVIEQYDYKIEYDFSILGISIKSERFFGLVGEDIILGGKK